MSPSEGINLMGYVSLLWNPKRSIMKQYFGGVIIWTEYFMEDKLWKMDCFSFYKQQRYPGYLNRYRLSYALQIHGVGCSASIVWLMWLPTYVSAGRCDAMSSVCPALANRYCKRILILPNNYNDKAWPHSYSVLCCWQFNHGVSICCFGKWSIPVRIFVENFLRIIKKPCLTWIDFSCCSIFRKLLFFLFLKLFLKVKCAKSMQAIHSMSCQLLFSRNGRTSRVRETMI